MNILEGYNKYIIWEIGLSKYVTSFRYLIYTTIGIEFVIHPSLLQTLSEVFLDLQFLDVSWVEDESSMLVG